MRTASAHVGPAWRLILRDLGLDEPSVLRRAGLPADVLDGDGSVIRLDDYYALFEAVEAEAEDPAVALHAGKVVSIELFDPALFAAICCPNMNIAATRLGEFKALVGAFTLDVEVDDDQTWIRYRCKHRPDLPRGLGLSELGILLGIARRATRHPIKARRVTVQRLPDDLAPYTTFFGCNLDLGEDYSLTLFAEDAARPFLTHNARMWEVFEPDLRRRMSEADAARSTRERVEAALFELLPSGRSEMKDVAKALGVGQRTLQRRLSAEGTTWLEVLSRTRERLARHYLGRTAMSPAEVSFLLGFEDPNSLFRAFRRWTGTTPEAWRAKGEAHG